MDMMMHDDDGDHTADHDDDNMRIKILETIMIFITESNTGKGCALPPWLTEGIWRSLGLSSSSMMVITEDNG